MAAHEQLLADKRATYDSVAFRFLVGNEHPDHGTIAAFRKRFLGQIESLFVEVLQLARAMGMLKVGIVAIDGTKLHANASRHSALSYGHARKVEKRLSKEVQQLLRLAAIAEAKAQIEARAQERQVQEPAEQEKRTGKKPGGRPPAAPTGGVQDSDQINLTDDQSRIMRVAGNRFEQCYNAQAACW